MAAECGAGRVLSAHANGVIKAWDAYRSALLRPNSMMSVAGSLTFLSGGRGLLVSRRGGTNDPMLTMRIDPLLGRRDADLAQERDGPLARRPAIES